MKNALSIILSVCLAMAIILPSSSSATGRIADSPNGPEMTAEPLKASGDQPEVKVALPGSMQGLADIIQKIAKNEGINANISTLGNGREYTENLIEQAAEDTPPDIYWVRGEADASQTYNAGLRPVNLAKTKMDISMQRLTALVPLEMRILDPEKVYGLPVGINAYGYLINVGLLAPVLNTKDTMRLQRDLQDCSFEEWAALCEIVNNYMEKPTKQKLSLAGHQYITTRFRPEETRNLQGIFAAATEDRASYMKNTLQTAIATVYESEGALISSSPDEMASYMVAPLQATFGLLDLETSYMTSGEGALKKGEGFVAAKKADTAAAEKLFAENKALVLKCDLKTGRKLEAEYPMLSGEVALVPPKLPIENENISNINYMFGMDTDGYLCINKNGENKKSADSLLLRLFTSQTGITAIEEELKLTVVSNLYPRDRLSNQLVASLTLGTSYPLPAIPSTLAAAEAGIGEWVNNELMNKEEWGDAEWESFLLAADGAIRATDFTSWG